MASTARVFIYTCKSCSTRMRPKDGDCCVFCSYSDAICPPKQSRSWAGCAAKLTRSARRERPRIAELQQAVIYRYVLHLDSAEGRRTLRWTFAQPVLAHEEIELPTFGRWYVSRAVTDEGPTHGVLYCTPALYGD
jgi:hypothetical protein